MLRWRLAAAAAILIPLFALLVADYQWSAENPGVWLVLPGLAAGWLATGEMLDLTRVPGHKPLGGVAYLGVTAVFLAACLPMGQRLLGPAVPPAGLGDGAAWVLLAVAFTVAAGFWGEVRRFPDAGQSLVNLALALLIPLYVGLPLAFAAGLRQYHDNGWGMAALVSVIWVVKLSDTGAYFGGKRLGRRKLCPQLSPGKTVEGGLAGLAAAVAASWLFFRTVAPWLAGAAAAETAWWRAAAYGLLLGALGMLGDLGESLIKRTVGRKDSSSWLPGLGGMLDVLDSLFLTLPAAYLAWNLGLVGPGR